MSGRNSETSIGLADATTFGEDLARSSQRALEIAPLFCGACLNYHMLFPIKRYLSTVANIPDRSELIGAIGNRWQRA